MNIFLYTLYYGARLLLEINVVCKWQPSSHLRWFIVVSFACDFANTYNIIHFNSGRNLINFPTARFSTSLFYNTPFDETILEVLVCPVSKKPLRLVKYISQFSYSTAIHLNYFVSFVLYNVMYLYVCVGSSVENNSSFVWISKFDFINAHVFNLIYTHCMLKSSLIKQIILIL